MVAPRNAIAMRITITSNPISETATSDLRLAGVGVGVAIALDSGLGAAAENVCERRRKLQEVRTARQVNDNRIVQSICGVVVAHFAAKSRRLHTNGGVNLRIEVAGRP